MILLSSSFKARAEQTIDFSRSADLRVLYEGGLRPWRVAPDERSNLKVTNQGIRVITPLGTSFDFSTEIGSFDILADNQIGKASFISQPVPLQEAGEITIRVCRALKISSEGLDKEIARFGSSPGMAAPPHTWTGSAEVGDKRFSVTMQAVFGLEAVLGKVYVDFEFIDPNKPMKFMEEPLKPPAGYEHVSMDPPVSSSKRDPLLGPEFSPEAMRQRMLEAKQAELDAIKPDSAPPGRRGGQDRGTRNSAWKARAENSEPWPWLVAALLALVAIGLALFKVLRR